LAAGKALYRDIAYFNGPLSPVLNALWFWLFGPSLWTLIWVNLALLALLSVFLSRLLLAISDRVASTVGGLAFLLLFIWLVWVRNESGRLRDAVEDLRQQVLAPEPQR
jgi:hypothetical protein